MPTAPSSESPLEAAATERNGRADTVPVTVLVEVEARPETQTEVLTELVATAERWAREPGCLEVTVLRDPANAARFLVLETFASALALQAHQELPSTHAFVGRIRQHLVDSPSRTTWHLASPSNRPRQPDRTGTRTGRDGVMTGARRPEEINVRWTEAFNAGDLAAMLELYEPDAMLVPGPDEAPVSGLVAIEASLRQLIGLRGKITFAPRYWLQHGDLALGGIDFHLVDGTDPSGNPVDLRDGTAEVARRQPDGTWKYVFDHPFAVPRA